MGAVDYGIMAIYLVLVVGVGYLFRLKKSSFKEFFQANRSMGWVPIGLSVMVTAFSVINYMALPTEVLGNGLYVVVSLPVFFIAAWLVSTVWLPFFYALDLQSVYQYFELRFDRRVRILASLVFIFWRLFWIATALYAAGQLSSKLTGLRVEYIIILAGLVATGYTTVGGIRAVMWTDCLQFVVLFGGIALGLYTATSAIGIEEFFNTAAVGGRLRPIYPFDSSFFSFDPTIRISFWSGLIGVTVAFISRYGADQVIMQRYFTARSLLHAQRGLWLNAAVAVISLVLLVFFGLALYVHGVEKGALGGVDLATLSPVVRKNLALKEFLGMIKSFPVGILGLVVSGLLAATMSTVDSGVNAVLNAYVADIHPFLHSCFKKRGAGHTDTSREKFDFNRLGTIIFGSICTALALVLIPLVGRSQSIFVIVNKVINALGSPLLALFILAMFVSRSNSIGVFIGGGLGFLFSVFSAFIIHGLSLHYYGVINLIVTLALGYFVSIIAAMAGCSEASGNAEYLYKNRKKIRD